MARSKRLLILLGVLVAACIAAFAALHWQEKQEQIAVSGEEVLSIDPDSVQSLSWTYGGTSLAFSRDETGGWTYDNDAAFPVDPEVMEGLLRPSPPSPPPSSSRTRRTAASTAWTIRNAPSPSKRRTKLMRSSWAAPAPWTASATSPLAVGPSIWRQRTR